ncbi:hypothetical protein pb186bvf_020514 [Paramecium bursaria]
MYKQIIINGHPTLDGQIRIIQKKLRILLFIQSINNMMIKLLRRLLLEDQKKNVIYYTASVFFHKLRFDLHVNKISIIKLKKKQIRDHFDG